MSTPSGTQRCECQCHWDMSWLRFGGDTTVSPMDVDGILTSAERGQAGDDFGGDGLFLVQRRAAFLFIETKRVAEVLSLGQRIALEHLSRLPKTAVVVIRGDNHHPETMQSIVSGKWFEPETIDCKLFEDRVDDWFIRATVAAGNPQCPPPQALPPL